jgi:hypothetical protein
MSLCRIYKGIKYESPRYHVKKLFYIGLCHLPTMKESLDYVQKKKKKKCVAPPPYHKVVTLVKTEINFVYSVVIFSSQDVSSFVSVRLIIHQSRTWPRRITKFIILSLQKKIVLPHLGVETSGFLKCIIIVDVFPSFWCVFSPTLQPRFPVMSPFLPAKMGT